MRLLSTYIAIVPSPQKSHMEDHRKNILWNQDVGTTLVKGIIGKKSATKAALGLDEVGNNKVTLASIRLNICVISHPVFSFHSLWKHRPGKM